MAKLDRLVKRASAHFDCGEALVTAVLGDYETDKNWVRTGVLVATNRRILF